MVNLTDEQLKKNVSALSGGQQQRVAIARALALNPEIIVLDEPLSNLDAKLRKSLRLELKKIQKASGTTMIYVTHDQEEALTLSDPRSRCFIMEALSRWERRGKSITIPPQSLSPRLSAIRTV